MQDGNHNGDSDYRSEANPTIVLRANVAILHDAPAAKLPKPGENDQGTNRAEKSVFRDGAASHAKLKNKRS